MRGTRLAVRPAHPGESFPWEAYSGRTQLTDNTLVQSVPTQAEIAAELDIPDKRVSEAATILPLRRAGLGAR